ncbi:hypothetical protein [Streptomyces sp. NPDC056323]|uniref:hypothetical protein n=1 Tax=Streptomyces sp. NPDC056323 TaxID=3345784 RepID=UPI0035D58B8F
MTPSIAPTTPMTPNDVAAHAMASYVRTAALHSLPAGGTAGKVASADAILNATGGTDPAGCVFAQLGEW